MNSSINVTKFLIAIYMVVFHVAALSGYKYFEGGYIFVEWFFIFAGFMVAKKVLSLEKNEDTFIEAVKIVRARIVKIFPYYLLSCIAAILFKLYTNTLAMDEIYTIKRILNEIFMLQMITVSTYPLTGTSWFLSSMWIILILILPFFIKLKKKFMIPAIIISLSLYYITYRVSGYLWGPAEKIIIFEKGNIRAAAAISIGIISYMLYDKLKTVLKHPYLETIFVWVCNLLIFYYISIVDESIYYFLLPFAFMILIAIDMGKSKNAFIPDNKFTRFLGTVSMIIYMNHFYIVFYMTDESPFLVAGRTGVLSRLSPTLPYADKVISALVWSLSISISIYIIHYLISKIHKLICKKV